MVPLDGGSPVRIADNFSTDPSWSPVGDFLVYAGPQVGVTFDVGAVTSDGKPRRIPALTLTRGVRRISFRPDGGALVVLLGERIIAIFRSSTSTPAASAGSPVSAASSPSATSTSPLTAGRSFSTGVPRARCPSDRPLKMGTRLVVLHRRRAALAGRVHHDRRRQRVFLPARRAVHLRAGRGARPRPPSCGVRPQKHTPDFPRVQDWSSRVSSFPARRARTVTGERSHRAREGHAPVRCRQQP